MDNCDYSGGLMAAGNGYIGYAEWVYPYSACDSSHRNHRQTDPGQKTGLDY
jgi:hypothetical protein